MEKVFAQGTEGARARPEMQKKNKGDKRRDTTIRDTIFDTNTIRNRGHTLEPKLKPQTLFVNKQNTQKSIEKRKKYAVFDDSKA